MKNYKVKIWAGTVWLEMNISAQLIYHSSGTMDVLTHDVIRSLVSRASLTEHLPVDSRQEWVMVVGPGLGNIVGRGYRELRTSDFHPPKGYSPPAISANVTFVCRGWLIPASAIPHACARQGCEEWATNHYGVRDTASAMGHALWGKTWHTGDVIWCCPRHAHELMKEIQVNEFILFPERG